MKKYDVILKKGWAVVPSAHQKSLKIEQVDIGILGGKIVEISTTLNPKNADEVISLDGLHVLPGVIDTQVHFREPGLTHKEDFESGTRSAIMGGVTTVFDMPNTNPATTSHALYLEKYNLIKQKSHCDFGLFFGATESNATEAQTVNQLPSCCGLKIFMGSSTGSLLVQDDVMIENHFRTASHQKVFAIHAEDEAILKERKKNLEKQFLTHKNPVSLHPVWRNEKSALRATQRR